MENMGVRTQSGGPASKIDYVEVDSSGRYARLGEILGKGAMKIVYKAFDKVLGMEVAWCQVMLNDVLRCPDDLQRMYSEVHLLKSLNHESIIKFYHSWIDVDRKTFNFITELLTSGTLREYRRKHKEIDIRAIKNWARQILHGLVHLHSLDPPVIHRDIKCDNIFVNGHLGQVKIGDLGLATVLCGSQHAHSVIGTPEFMAPEIYEEEYDELVDVYSFGMCVLEMLTSEYPYSECSSTAQIYKKVASGKKPKAFYQIQDAEAQQFLEKCLETASKRSPAHELLLDPFLALDEELMPVPIAPLRLYSPKGQLGEMPFLLDNLAESTEMSINGTINPEDNTICLKVQIPEEDGWASKIQFVFDINKDTAMDVATEMVKELDITDWEPHEIAGMIEEEISALVPAWKDLNSPKSFQQHSFHYDEDDDENQPPYLPCSPSLVSFSDFSGLCEGVLSYDLASSDNFYNSVQDYAMYNEDASSESSSSSNNYSYFEYTSQKPDVTVEGCSRFCLQENTPSTQCELHNGIFTTVKGLSSNGHRKLSKMRSLMDIRSQLLHRAVMQAANKEQSAKTVGSVENIGFHDLC